MSKVHVVKDKNSVVRHYRVIPYSELAEILKREDTAFLEDSAEQRLKRQTVHKAARKLTGTVGKKVVAEKGFLKLDTGANLEGYLFSVVEPESRRLKGKSS
jgi:hypothetical protein